MTTVSALIGDGRKPARRGFSILLVVTMLTALGILLLAFLRKGSQQASWTMKHVHERVALEAAFAGITAAEDRLLGGRWYACEGPQNGVGQFSLLVDNEMPSSVFVVCQDTYSRVFIPNGDYPTSRGMVSISTPHGYFHTLHSVNVFSRGTCKDVTKMVFARFVVSPEPLAHGGSMEGIRFLTDGKRDAYPLDELVAATWEGTANGALKTFVCLPSQFDEHGSGNAEYSRWKFQVLVSPGDLVAKGQPLYRAETSWSSCVKTAQRPGKVLKVIRECGEGYSDEPVLLIRDSNAFESSGHTLKKMVRLTPIPKEMAGNDNPADESDCRSVVRKYISSLEANYLSRSNVVFEHEESLPKGPLADDEAKNIFTQATPPATALEFLRKRFPTFVPPGLSPSQTIDYAVHASVILDKTPPPVGDPSPDELLLHNRFFGLWPSDKARNAMRFSQPDAIRKMLDCIADKTDFTSLSAYIRTATTFQKGTYVWECDYRGPAEDRHEIIGDSFDSDPASAHPPDAEWVAAGGMNYLVLSKSPGTWYDNAYDLEFGEKRIRMRDVALFLAKIASDGGELPPDSGPERVLISDAKAPLPAGSPIQGKGREN